MAAYFLSDTHLSPQQPEVYDKFIRYLEFIRNDADDLYILGDLFDYWIGDDGIELLGHRQAVEALANLSAHGTKISVMHGNRDFLIGQSFIDQIGASLISDPTTIELNGQPVLLMHGDSLCTDDVAHQRYRTTVLSTQWQDAILALPLSERLDRALAMRNMSEQGKQTKTQQLMDVNLKSVIKMMEAHAVHLLIHGHTHRPAIHDVVINGSAAKRYVLGDWGRGYDAVIRVDSNGVLDLHNATV